MSSNFVLIHHDGKVYPLLEGDFTIGRGKANNLILIDPSISRSHARILVRGERCWLRDENSASGTFVNDKRVQGQQEIFPGDLIRVGNHNFRFGIGDPALHTSPQKHKSLFLVLGGIGISAIIGIALTGLFGGGGPTPGPSSQAGSGPVIEVSDDLVISDDAKTVSAEDQEKISAITEEGTIIFEDTSPELEGLNVGDVLVGDISAVAPDGFLRRVTGVSMVNGQLEIKTTQASLGDLVEQGTISVHYPITASDVASYTGQERGVKLASVVEPFQSRPALLLNLTNVAGNKTYIDGSIKFTPDLDFEIRYDDGLEYANIQLIANEQVNLTIKSTEFGIGVGATYDITRLPLHRFKIWVGGFPIIVRPIIVVKAGFEGDVEIGLEHKVVQTGRFSAGLEYDHGELHPYKELEINYEYSQQSVFVETEVKGFAGPEIFLKFYGVAGPYVATHFTVQLKGHVGLDSFISVESGIEVKAGLKIDIPILDLHVDLIDELLVLSVLEEVYRHEFMITPATETYQPEEQTPFIELLAPNGGEIWLEGETYSILWGSVGVNKIDIAVAVGGKDKGYIATGIDATEGQYRWTIPDGFISDFGIQESQEVSVMVTDSENSGLYDLNDRGFTIKAGSGNDPADNSTVDVYEYSTYSRLTLTCEEVSDMTWTWGCASSGEYVSLPDQRYLIILDDVESTCPDISLSIIENSCD